MHLSASARTASLVAALLAGGSLGAAAPASAAGQSFPRPSDGVVQLIGHGSGNGIGLSRWGAYAQAQAGRTYRQVLAMYFAGTALRSTVGGTVDVRLTDLGAAALDFPAVPGLRLRFRSAARVVHVVDPPTTLRGCRPLAWRVALVGGAIVVTGRCAGEIRTLLAAGTVDASASVQVSDTDGTTPIRQGDLRLGYRGSYLLSRQGPALRVVGRAPREEYLRTVVPSLVPAGWHREVLRAQAVAARTLAVRARSHAGSAPYDLRDDDAQLPYAPAVRYSSTWAVTARGTQASTDAALSATTGQYLTYGGLSILAASGSSNGGWTADGGRPYLRAAPDPYDTRLGANDLNGWWARTVRVRDLEAAAPSIGRLTALRIDERSGGGEWGGRVRQVSLVGTKGTRTYTGEAAVTRVLGTRSTYLRVRAASLHGWVFPLPAGSWRWGTPYHKAGPLWSSGYHTGQDFPTPRGTPVYAIAAGQVVVDRSTSGGYGTFVVLQHGDGLRSLYAHLTSSRVRLGEGVAAGEQLGLSGSTGNSTGPHLHLELAFSGHATDPVPFLVGAPRPTTVPLLHGGSTGTYVREVQRRLGRTVSGWFGPGTTVAVRAFQQQHAIAVTGTTTQAFWRLLRDLG